MNLGKMKVLVIFFLSFYAWAEAQHFTYTPTSNDMSVALLNVTINGTAIVAGDEIGAFKSDGTTCVGRTIWTGSPGGITVYGADTTPALPGMAVGETVKYKVWDASANTEYTAVPTYTQGDGNYAENGMQVISTLAATGTVPTYTLTVTSGGNGTVTLNPTGGVYSSGVVVTLTPVPNSGYTFSSWTGTNSGDIVNTGGIYTIAMNSNKSVQANFAASTGLLGDVNKSGTITSSDALIILSCAVGNSVSQYCPLDCGDVNASNTVTSSDALVVLSYSVGLTVPYPVGQSGCPTGVTPCLGCN